MIKSSIISGGFMKAKKASELELKDIPSFKLPVKQQLIRTTLRLTEDGHASIRKLAKSHGWKNADIFESMVQVIKKFKLNSKDFFRIISKETKTTRKTYVIKKNTLVKLSNIAENGNFKRDLLIDKMARLLIKIAENETDKKDREYQSILTDIINPFWEKAEKIWDELKEKLGEDDAILSRFGIICIHFMNLSQDIESYLNEGTPISED